MSEPPVVAGGFQGKSKMAKGKSGKPIPNFLLFTFVILLGEATRPLPQAVLTD